MSDETEVRVEVPQSDDDGDGRGVWHEDAEMRKLIRPMTPREVHYWQTWDNSLLDMRRESLARIAALEAK